MKLVLLNRKTDEVRIIEAGTPFPCQVTGASPEDVHWDVLEGYEAYQLGRQEKAAEVLEALTREFFKGDQS